MARKIRKRNRIMLFAAEGHNETEKLYLRDLINDTKGFVFKKAYGTNTDPSGMIKNIIATMNEVLAQMMAILRKTIQQAKTFLRIWENI